MTKKERKKIKEQLKVLYSWRVTIQKEPPQSLTELKGYVEGRIVSLEWVLRMPKRKK